MISSRNGSRLALNAGVARSPAVTALMTNASSVSLPPALPGAALALAQAEVLQLGDVGLVHVRHVRHQDHAGDHLARHLAADRAQRLDLHRALVA